MPTLAESCPEFELRYPLAYHVLPLHAARSIWNEQQLLSKEELRRRGRALSRSSTQAVDTALGFGDYVHFYLTKKNPPWTELPILGAQLGPSTVPPFPHVVLEVSPASFDIEHCLVSNWNIAVGRPDAPPKQKGGNWTRGTSAKSVCEGWKHFRTWLAASSLSPDAQRLRARGHWHEGFQVPILRGAEIADHFPLIGRGKAKPEFLHRSPCGLPRTSRFVAFSSEDLETLRRLGIPESALALESFPGYDGSLVDPEVRRTIEAYLAGAPAPANLHFDRVRPSRR